MHTEAITGFINEETRITRNTYPSEGGQPKHNLNIFYLPNRGTNYLLTVDMDLYEFDINSE